MPRCSSATYVRTPATIAALAAKPPAEALQPALRCLATAFEAGDEGPINRRDALDGSGARFGRMGIDQADDLRQHHPERAADIEKFADMRRSVTRPEHVALRSASPRHRAAA